MKIEKKTKAFFFGYVGASLIRWWYGGVLAYKKKKKKKQNQNETPTATKELTNADPRREMVGW